MSRIIFSIVFLIFLFGIDFYVFNSIKLLTRDLTNSVRNTIHFTYWGLSSLVFLGILFYRFLPLNFWNDSIKVLWQGFVMVSVFSKLFVVVFLFLEDITRLIRWGGLQTKQVLNPNQKLDTTISRSEFISKLALGAGAIPAVTFTYGILSGAHDYRIEKVNLKIPHLPKEFKGLQIAQVSDIHSGSFFNKTAVKGGVEMLMNEKPDIIFFTGDLVNNKAEEVKDYIPVFEKFKAPLGVYSTLGNHDYGDYVAWNSEKEKRQNLEDLKKAHKIMGFDLLMDENRIIRSAGEQLAILGVQNIGIGRFPWYGNLEKAYEKTEDASVKLLLSHDPSHWNAEVTEKYKDIQATFAGHTHGSQFGVKLGESRWSPAQHLYKQWAGLYQEGDQQIYVNRGYGYIGYPGRVGMPPEITIFTLS